MDKLKNMISPGHAADDEKLYGTGGTTASPSSGAPGQIHDSTATSRVAGSSEVENIAGDAKAMPGSTHMPGGFDASPQEESTRRLGHSSSAQPSTASTAQSTSIHPSTTGNVVGPSGATSGLAPESRTPYAPGANTIPPSSSTSATHPTSRTTGVPTSSTRAGHAAVAPTGLAGADDTASTTSIKSGIPGNTTTASSVPTSGIGSTTAASAIPGTHTSPSSTRGTTSMSTQDPYMAPSTGFDGTTALPRGAGGVSSGRVEDPSFSNRTLHDSSGHSATSGSHGREALAGAAAGATGLEYGKHHGTHHASMTHPSNTGVIGTSSHVPNTGTASTTHSTSGIHNSQPTSGTTGVASTLSDRTRPHADVGETVVERSFPLGGHAGEGPHPISTANRLNPAVADSAAEFREGTHHHGQHHQQHHHHAGTGAATAGAGLGAGALAGEEARHHHGAGGYNSGVGDSTNRSVPVSQSTTVPHGSTNVSSTTGPAGTGTGPTMTSGGVGESAGHTYNTLPSGTASGISSRDPAHSSTIPGQTTSTSNTHGSNHLGRDAALGAGAVGLGSGAAYETSRHPGTSQPSEPTKATMTSGGVGQPAGHKYNTLSDGTPSGIAPADPAHPQHSSHVPGTSSVRADPTSTTGHTSSGHHVGRDVGVAGAGAGATGLAAQEYEKHRGHPSSSSGVERAAEGRSAGAALNHRPVAGYEGPQSIPGEHGIGPSTTSTAAQRAQESLNRYPEHTSSQIPTQHGHTGRDAAAVGGVGGAGTTAAYEAEKYKHGRQDPTSTSTINQSGPASTHQGHTGRDVAAGTAVGGAGTTAAYEAEKHKHGHQGPTSTSQSGSHQGHTGRDVAAGTAVGGTGTAAAYEAEKHHHGKESSRDAKHESKYDSKHDSKSPEEKKPGLLDKIIHPSRSKEQEREIEQEKKDRAAAEAVDSRHHDTAHGTIPTKTDNITSHHKGEAAAVGGAGATGLAGSEASRHVDPHHSKERTAAMPGSGVHGTGAVGGASQPGAYEGAQAAAQRHGYSAPSSGQGHHTGTTTSHTGHGIDPRVDTPQYGSTNTTSGELQPSQGEFTAAPGYGGSPSAERSTNTTKGYTSRVQEDPRDIGDSPSSARSGGNSGGLSNLLHRDNPNKLHKDPPNY